VSACQYCGFLDGHFANCAVVQAAERELDTPTISAPAENYSITVIGKWGYRVHHEVAAEISKLRDSYAQLYQQYGPKPCCQNFLTCKEADCIPRLKNEVHQLQAKILCNEIILDRFRMAIVLLQAECDDAEKELAKAKMASVK
jgi:hypothetical protein